MKLRLLQLGKFALAGAVTNVAVAWGCLMGMEAWYEPDTRGLWKGAVWKCNNDGVFQWIVMRTGGGSVTLHQYPDITPEGIEALRQGFADTVTAPELLSLPGWSAAASPICPCQPRDLETFIVDDAHGWPLISMRYRVVSYFPSSRFDLAQTRLVGGIPIRSAVTFSGFHARQALPLIPIWPGFAINTILYAAIVWLLFVAPFRLRRWRRVRRRLCPGCGYPVGSSAVCTECGQPIAESIGTLRQ